VIQQTKSTARGAECSVTKKFGGLESLGQRAREGDVQAMGVLLSRLTPYVQRVARNVLGHSGGELDDCTQESLLAFSRAFPSFREESTVLHFAHRIATRTAYTARRRLRRTLGPVESLAEEGTSAEIVEWPPDTAGQAEQRRVLSDLLHRLPETQANALILFGALGYSLREAAQRQGVSVDTLRSRVRQAKRVLRKTAAEDARVSELLSAD
jgi:RNA polymerase sigma-70 factor, ECF subfamily